MQMPQSRSQMPHNYSHCNNLTANSMLHKLAKPGPSPREALTSLGLLCLSKPSILHFSHPRFLIGLRLVCI